MPRDVAIPAGTLVTLDIGARARRLLLGLHAHLGDRRARRRPGRDLRDRAAAQEARSRPSAGPDGREVDAVARDLIAAAGHGEHFGHGLGHGVGLEVHEAPRLAQTVEARLAPGNVVTVEPGIYVPGRGGVRIEDLVVVTEDGHEVLSATTKDLTVVA